MKNRRGSIKRRGLALVAGALLVLGIAGCAGDTDPATDIRASQAMLGAHGRTTGKPATYWWEYSTSQSTVQNGGGTQICGSPPQADRRCGPVQYDAKDVKLTQVVKGLTPDTTYYFRACGQDEGASPACGRILSFRTATVAAPGELVVADSAAFSATRNSGALIRVNPTTGAQTTISEGNNFITPHGVTFDAAGNILVVDEHAFNGHGGVIRVDPRTGAQTVIGCRGCYGTPTAIAVEPDGNIVVADDDAFDWNGAVFRVNPTTGAVTTVSRGGSFVDPYGIGVRSNGDILVADQDAFPDGTGVCGAGVTTNGRGGVIKVDPTTGAQTTVSSGGNFCDADNAEVGPNGGFYVADLTAFGGQGGVICVNPSTGTQYVISQKGSFGDPADVAVANDNTVFVSDHKGNYPAGANAPEIFKVNPATGAQTLITYSGSFVRPEGIAVVPGAPPGPATTPCAR